MPGWFEALTEAPEFIKKRTRQMRDSVESPSVFDEPYEKYTKPAIKAAADTADVTLTPLAAIGELAGFAPSAVRAGKAALAARGAGKVGKNFAGITAPYKTGAITVKNINKLEQIPALESYKQFIQQGMSHEDAAAAAAKGYKKMDELNMYENLDELYSPAAKARRAAEVAARKGALGKANAPIRQTAGKGESIIDLAESVRKNARRPYATPGGDWDQYLKTEWAKYGK
jgi:hypothetical protein